MFKRITAALLIALILVSVFPINVFAASKSYVQVTGSSVNIRKGAGTSYAKIGTASKGGSYELLGSGNDKNGIKWYKIKYSSTKNGWISSKYSKIIQKESTPTTTASSRTVKITGSSVNVRKGAGASYAKVGVAYKNKSYKYLGSKKNGSTLWYKIQFTATKTGWVSSVYASLSASATTIPSGSTETTVASTAASSVNPTETTVHTTTSATTETTSATTVKPTSVSTTTATEATTSTTTAAAPSTKKTGTVTCASLNVRKGAGTSYAVVTAIKKGYSFEITGQKKVSGSIWYSFKRNGSTVWVSGKYISVKASTPTPYAALSVGSSGDAVTKMQTRLRTLGYIAEVPDGSFGINTKKAVISFQKRAGLSPTGIADNETLTLLYSSAAPKAPVTYNHTDVLKPNYNKDYYIIVYKKNCSVLVLGKDDYGKYNQVIKKFTCSVGKNNSTPDGLYSISQRYKWRLMVGNVYAQYAVRFYGSYLFHSVPYVKTSPSTLQMDEYKKLGTAASHGCVRLCVRDSKWIYDNAANGTQVRVLSNKNGPTGTEPIPSLNSSSEFKGWDPTDPHIDNPYKK